MTAAESSALRTALLARANASGGWGYYPGKTSRLEPTCWALLALGGAAGDFDADPHWRFLAACQRSSGLLVEDPSLPVNLAFNALAAVTMQRQRRPGFDSSVGAVLKALVAQAGLQVAQSPNFRQDNSLRGWPWTEGTFSWVEPTCWALLALKRAASRDDAPKDAAARVEEGERMLIDRCCRDGGWNYGNANALGKELFPYVSVTALALLALQNRRDHPAVSKSLEFLQQHWPAETSTIGLGLSAICLRHYGVAVDRLERALTEKRQLALNVGNNHAIAIALYATAPAANDTAFTI